MTGGLVDFLTVLIAASASALAGWSIGCAFATRRLREQQRTEKAQASRTLESLNSVADLVVSELRSHKRSVGNIITALSASGDETQAVTDALANLLKANQEMEERILSAEAKLEEQAKELHARSVEAHTDGLTQLVNRRTFREELERRYQESQRTQRPLSVLLMDIDNFKQFNDAHGHQVGDEVLRGVAATLHQTVREMDLVARYGGEEFGVVLPNTPVVVAVAVAERLREAVERLQVRYDGEDFRVTISIGAAELRSTDHVSVLLRRADEALYASKAAGRNCTHWEDGRTILRGGHSAEVPPPELPPSSKPVTRRSRQQTRCGDPSTDAPPAAKPSAQDNCPADDFCSWSALWHSARSRLAEWKRGGSSLCVALIGLDDQDVLRRRHGEAALEAARISVGRQVAAALREMDLVAARQDGGFAILCPRLTKAQIPFVAERLAEFLGDGVAAGRHLKIPLHLSIGWAEATEGDDTDRLLDRAQAALQAAQAAGGNGNYVHNDHWPEPLRTERVENAV